MIRRPPRSTLFPYTDALPISLLPDIIVLDVMIPEMDGFTVCEILRREPATVNIPILMLTARPGELDRKSTRLNSSHSQISYAVFCLKKKKNHVHTHFSYTH